MGFSNTGFETRQKIGVWGELTFLNHFEQHPEYGLRVFPYGETAAGRKKADTDAVIRPDLLIFESAAVNRLRAQGIVLTPGPPAKARTDLRPLSDSSPGMKAIVQSAMVAIEVKFSHRRYEEGHVNFIIDEGRKARYDAWLKRMDSLGAPSLGALMVWMTTDRAWVAPVSRVLREGTQETRTYEMQGRAGRQKTTWNLPVEAALHFANVVGYELNKTFVAKLKWTKSGGVEFDVDDDPGDFDGVDVVELRKLALSARHG